MSKTGGNLSHNELLEGKNPPRTPEKLRISSPSNQMGQPDDNLPTEEGIAQGLPPVQVSSSENYLDEGHLGEISKGWGRDLTTPPSPLKTPQTMALRVKRLGKKLQVLKLSSKVQLRTPSRENVKNKGTK